MKKKIFVFGLAAAVLCMATACNDKGKDSGDMADNRPTQESSSRSDADGTDSFGSDKDLTANTTNNTSDSITGTGGANGNDNISIWDDADNPLDDLISDAADGITDMTDNLINNIQNDIDRIGSSAENKPDSLNGSNSANSSNSSNITGSGTGNHVASR